MTWNFRGSLSRLDFKRNGRITLPFRGCAWLGGHDKTGTLSLAAGSVRDAALELVEMADLRVEAMQEEANAVAERNGAAPQTVTGCVYTLGDMLHIIAGIDDNTVAVIKNGLLPALLDGRLHRRATVAFPEHMHLSPDMGERTPAASRRVSRGGHSVLYFDACNLSVAFNPWGAEAAQRLVEDDLVPAGGAYPRL